jgi:hypothetical protein
MEGPAAHLLVRGPNGKTLVGQPVPKPVSGFGIQESTYLDSEEATTQRFGLRFRLGLRLGRRLSDRRRRSLNLFLGLRLLDRLIVPATCHYGQGEPGYQDESTTHDADVPKAVLAVSHGNNPAFVKA